MVKIDLRTWQTMKEQKKDDQAVPVVEEPEQAPEEAQGEGQAAAGDVLVNAGVAILDVRNIEPPAPFAVIVQDAPPEDEPEEPIEEAPELVIVIPYPVMMISAVAVKNGEGKEATDLYELDLKMRVTASDLGHIAQKLSGHMCLATFKRMDEQGEL